MTFSAPILDASHAQAHHARDCFGVSSSPLFESAVKRICSWCGIIISPGLTQDAEQYAAFVTHSICPACIAKVDAQIAAVKDVDIFFSCPNCPAEASPYKVTVHGTHQDDLCPLCGMRADVDRRSPDRPLSPSVTRLIAGLIVRANGSDQGGERIAVRQDRQFTL